MLKGLADLRKFRIHAKDGDIGTVHSFLFDDASWTVRYIVVDTGGWLTGRKVLISPMAISKVRWDVRRVELELTMDQIRNSPDISSDLPVSRQKELEMAGYYGWPVYWQSISPEMPWLFDTVDIELKTVKRKTPGYVEGEGFDPHLQSTESVLGYRVRSTEGFLGSVMDFIAEDRSWIIRYMVIGSPGQPSGKNVIVGVNWVEAVDWEAGAVDVRITKEAYDECPGYDPRGEIDRAYEIKVHERVCQPRYWDSPARA